MPSATHLHEGFEQCKISPLLFVFWFVTSDVYHVGYNRNGCNVEKESRFEHLIRNSTSASSMEELIVPVFGVAIDCAHGDPFAQNATLGPLQIDYLYIHYCTFAGVPLVSSAVLLLWLSVLFFFRMSTSSSSVPRIAMH